MSSRAVVVAVSVAMAWSAAGAQDVREQAARVDSFARAWKSAIARRVEHDARVERSRSALDTVHVGPIRMLVEPAVKDLATRAARLAVDSLAPLGSEALAIVTKHQFVVRTIASPRWAGTEARSIVVSVLDSARVERMQLWAPTTDARVVSRWFYQDAIHLVVAALDEPFERWLLVPVRFDSVSDFAWTQLRLDLVSSPASAARQCYDGDMRVCEKILGLTPVQDIVLEWYDAPSRRKVVDRLQSTLRRDDYDATERCLAGVDSSCVSVLQRWKRLSPVALAGHRVALVQLALQLGGEQSVARLLRATGTPAERIAVTAGVPADSVLRVWHSRIRNVRTPSDDMSPGIAAASLGWIVLLGALALRNSKWR